MDDVGLLTKDEIDTLESAIGAALSSEQIGAIGWTVHLIKGLQATARASPGAKEVKQHLNALAKAADDGLVLMYANADTITRAYMFDQLLAIGQLNNPTPEAIRQAAKSAWAALPKLEPGSIKGWQIFAAQWAIQSWRDCGGVAVNTAWESTRRDLDRGRKTKQYQSPIVEWAGVFFPQEPALPGEKQRPKLGARRIADLIAAELPPKEFANKMS